MGDQPLGVNKNIHLVYLRRFKPPIFSSKMVHFPVEIIKVFVTQIIIINDIPLPSGVMERISVPLAGEVKPLVGSSDKIPEIQICSLYLRMAKFIAFEIEIAFSAEGVRDETARASATSSGSNT